MSHNIHQLLEDMECQIEALNNTTLTEQQLTFTQHIKKTIEQLISLLNGLPPTEYVYLHTLPILGDQFLQPLVAVYGYARLMTEHPSTFENAPLSSHQRDCLQIIYQHGRTMENYVGSLQQQAFQYRLQARRQPIQPVNLHQLLRDNFPIYSYWIRHTQVNLDIALAANTFTVNAKPYHLNALIQHIIIVVATEFIDQGQITLTTYATNATELHFEISDFHVNLSHLQILFNANGRNTYYTQLQQMNGDVLTQLNSESGSTIVIRLSS